MAFYTSWTEWCVVGFKEHNANDILENKLKKWVLPWTDSWMNEVYNTTFWVFKWVSIFNLSK